MKRCQFCGCMPLEPCWDPETNWRCTLLGDDLCSMCVDEAIAGFEEAPTPTKLRLHWERVEAAHVVAVSGAFL